MIAPGGAAVPGSWERRTRRNTIPDAALQCFHREGFHGTGTDAFCREARGSSGHLYHCFPSKEARIEAIFEADRARPTEIVAGFASRPEPLEAVIDALVAGDSEELGLSIDAALALEMLAEASLNPRVSEILACFDVDARAALARLLIKAQADGRVAPKSNPELAVGLLLALGDGLLGRRISNSGQDRAAIARAMRRVTGFLLGYAGPTSRSRAMAVCVNRSVGRAVRSRGTTNGLDGPAGAAKPRRASAGRCIGSR